MNTQTSTLQAQASAADRIRTRWRDYVALTKPRITLLVIITTWVGFFVATPSAPDLVLLLHTLVGTALACSGSATLNQVWEVEADRKMKRTERRPLPAGRLTNMEGMAFGVALTVIGLLQLAVLVNLLSALLTGLTVAIYLFAYTPLKRHTWISTTVGAVPGALPPMIGWAAARGHLDMGAWVLFTIQFIWQLPHFYAIAWMYRDDYIQGGFRMLSGLDPDGRLTGNQIASWTTVLLPASLLLPLLGHAGALYAVAAVSLGGVFLAAGIRMALRPSRARARRVFMMSVFYLPILLGALVLDVALGV